MAAFYTRKKHRGPGRLHINIRELRRYTATKDLVAVYDNRENRSCNRLLYKDGTKRGCLYFTGGWYTIEIAETVQNYISPNIILTALDSERKITLFTFGYELTALCKGLF